MKKITANKTVTANTAALIENEENLTAKLKGLYSDYLRVTVIQFKSVAGTDGEKKFLQQVADSVKTLSAYDKERDSRQHKDLTAALNGLVKRTKQIADRVAGVTPEDLEAMDVLTLRKFLSKAGVKTETEETAETAETATETKVATATKPTETEKVDVKEETESVKNEIINHASELAKQTADSLTDTYLETLAEVEKVLEDFDPQKDQNKTALVTALLQKVLTVTA